MPRAAVLGRPIAHSLSPVLHGAAYAALGLDDWTYEAIDCGVAELPDVLAARQDWSGFSCTMPLKHAALDVAVSVSSDAAAIGSANTLLPVTAAGTTGWHADNTDVTGIVAAVQEHDVRPASVTVLGAGGTAQAVLAALVRLGIARCTVLVRDRSRAGDLLATAARLDVGVQVDALAPDAAALGADLVVSTVPAGGTSAVEGHAWSPGQAVLDVVYADWPTPLAREAAAGGATVISGALMLLHQAAAQVTAMTGRPAPVAAMRAALRAAVPGCGA